MLFNSFNFLLFFPLVVIAFFLIGHRFQWMLLLAASYFFYMTWKVEYGLLLLTTTVISYLTALGMARAGDGRARRFFLLFSITCTLGILFVFKYFDFFNDNVAKIFGYAGWTYSGPALDLLLPVGISFYTFQSLSYSIDVYRGRKEPEQHFGIFALYLSFFPLLLAGPIERASSLIPQLRFHKRFDYARVVSGLQLMLWGFFKKLVIADRLGLYVDRIYAQPALHPGLPALLGAYFFAFQIYCDFSGYTDIARGAARVMGFELSRNFNLPFLATSVTDYWRRWHISLSTWLRDYLYTPLVIAIRDRGVAAVMFSAFVTFVLCGLWHGAAWTYVLFGLLHGAALACEVGTTRVRKALASTMPSGLYTAISMLLTFHFVVFTLVIFRAQSLSNAYDVLRHIPQDLFSTADILGRLARVGAYERLDYVIAVFGIVFLEAIQWTHQRVDLVKVLAAQNRAARWGVYYASVFAIIIFGIIENTEFIYFQF